MKNKLSVVRKAGGGATSLLLAGCVLTALCFNPWTAYAVTGGEATIAGGQDNVSVTALEDASLWDGDLKKAGWGGGDVQPPSTYKEEGTSVTISGADGLAYFAYKVATDEDVKEYSVELTCDIDLDNHLWIPIGLASRSEDQDSQPMFSGTFNGGGHTIYNLSADEFAEGLELAETDHEENGWVKLSYNGVSISVPTADEQKNEEQNEYYNHEYTYGLFGVVGNATINNLNVASVNISLGERSIYGSSDRLAHNLIAGSAGALVGYAVGDLKLDGCTAGSTEGILNSSDNDDTEQIIPDLIEGATCVGGLVGSANAELEAGGSYGTVEIDNCTNYINVGGSSDVDIKAGILGYAENTASLKFDNCENYGDVYGDCAGGIISYWQVDEEGETANSGTCTWEFKDCKNYGNIKGTVNVGGIAGVGGATKVADGATYSVKITGCKNYGTVTNVADPTVIADGEGATGGIIGYLSLWAESSGERVLTENFNYGKVDGIQEEPTSSTTASTGGLIGYLNLNGIIEGISGGNYGRITGYSIENGCIGGCISGCDYSSYVYLINAYAVLKGAN